MAFNQTGFYTVSRIGTPDASVGSTRALHTYVTNDAAAGVETSGYFNAIAGRIKTGDILIASLDLDGTPKGRMYVMINTANVITIVPFEATAIA